MKMKEKKEGKDILDESAMFAELSRSSVILEEQNSKIRQLISDLKTKAFGEKEHEITQLSSEIISLKEALGLEEEQKVAMFSDINERNSLIKKLEADRQNLERVLKLKDEEFQTVNQRLLDKTQQTGENKRVIAELDAKIRSQIMQIESLKKELILTNQKLKTYVSELNPLKERFTNLNSENRRFKLDLEKRERDIRKLYLDLVSKEDKLKKGDSLYLGKIEEYRSEHDKKLKELVQRFTQERINLGSYIEQLKSALEKKDAQLKQREKLESDVVNELLNKFNVKYS